MPVYRDNKRGTWFVSHSYKDLKGKHRTTKKRGFKTKREAQAYEGQLINTKNNIDEMPFNQLYELYLEDAKSRNKESTINLCKDIVRHNVMPYFANKKLSSITPAFIRKWENVEVIGKNYAQTTQKSITSVVNKILNFAVRFYGLKQNPMAITGTVGSLSKRSKQYSVWNVDEFNKFIAVIPDEYRIYFYVLFYTGIRKGELVALTLNDFEDNVLHINKQMVKSREHKRWEIISPKTENSTRDITLPTFLVKMIEERKSKAVDCNEKFYPYKPTLATLRYQTERACKITGLNLLRTHDFRHSHASLLINIGVPLTTISKRLGHTPSTTLRVYAHAFADAENTVTQKLQDIYDTKSC